jgi:hypothetical protein
VAVLGCCAPEAVRVLKGLLISGFIRGGHSYPPFFD